MRKLVWAFSLCVFLCSCSSIFYCKDIRWSIKEVKNEWGELYGARYASFSKPAGGLYSNSWDDNSPCIISDIRFSKSFGLYFAVSRTPWLFNDNSVPVTIRVRNSGREYSFKGSYAGGNSFGYIRVPFSPGLASSLCNKNVSLHFTVAGVYKCRFDFPPNFNLIWENLDKNY